MAKKYNYTDNTLYYSDKNVEYKIRDINSPNKLKITKLILNELIKNYNYIDCSFSNLLKGYAEDL